MKLDGVLFLGANTSRTQAYLQALIRTQLLPESVLLFGDAFTQKQSSPPPSMAGFTFHDAAESPTASCERAALSTTHLAPSNVNAPEIIEAIRNAAPKLIIYSGQGGQIVGDELLAAAPQVLHLHSGWLPQYRGSTTVYYALLNGDHPGVSAIFLDRTIDTGPVVARKQYPKPPFGMDVDNMYDPAIRADLLIRVMRGYAESGHIPELEEHATDTPCTYYVMHPILKHLALLSCNVSCNVSCEERRP